MDPRSVYLNNTYHILVTQTSDHRVCEWFGNLTLSTQENGEIYVSLSIDDQPVEHLADESP